VQRIFYRAFASGIESKERSPFASFRCVIISLKGYPVRRLFAPAGPDCPAYVGRPEVTGARSANTEVEKAAILEKARQGAAYGLDDTIRTNSRNKAKRAVYATVEDATAQKEVDFEVEQTADGKMSISVSPFQF
jgi:hypothetical protein